MSDTPLPKEVEKHAEDIYRVDVETLFGHVADPDIRAEKANAYAKGLAEDLPGDPIILPMEVEKLGVSEGDELVTRSEVQEMIDSRLRDHCHHDHE